MSFTGKEKLQYHQQKAILAMCSREHPLTCTKNELFYVFKPIWRDELSKVLYKIQRIKLLEEASELFVGQNWERWSAKRVEV